MEPRGCPWMAHYLTCNHSWHMPMQWSTQLDRNRCHYYGEQALGRVPPLLIRWAALSIHGELPLEPRSNLYRRVCLGTDSFLAPLRGVSAAFSSHLRVTLASVLHLRLVGEPHTVGCLPMCRPLIHCTAVFIAKMSYAWRASRRDLRDPGRGDPGFRRC